jgi:hypothetical protein
MEGIVYILLFKVIFPVSAARPVETTESGCYHRSHDRTLKSLVGAIVPGCQIAVMGKPKPLIKRGINYTYLNNIKK